MYPSDIRAAPEEWATLFSNWGRWPDGGGTLNLITPDKVLSALQLATSGRVIHCGHELQPEVGGTADSSISMVADIPMGLPGYPERFRESADVLSASLHGLKNTHMDALCHIGHLERGFNGTPWAEMVSMEGGASKYAITDIPPVVTRGVLVDIPRTRGIDHMEPGDAVLVEEVEKAAPDLRAGDALLIRTGRWVGDARAATVSAPPQAEMSLEDVMSASPDKVWDIVGRYAGLHPDVLGYMKDRDAAILATDAIGEIWPPLPFPADCPAILNIHGLCEVYLGIPLMHSLDFDELAAVCAAEGRSDVLFSVAALRLPRATGSLIAPICVL